MKQLDLFSHVALAYAGAPGGELSNADLYAQVAREAGLSEAALSERTPIGTSGERHNLLKRSIRWHQQTLRRMGVVERDVSQRGAWKLAVKNKNGLHEATPTTRLIAFSTRLGAAIWGRCETALAGLDAPITAIITSPPYLLRTSRAYGGNHQEDDYNDFIVRSLEPLISHLAPGGSICLNLNNDAFVPGSPARSLYREKLLIRLSSEFGLFKMDTIIWSNPSRIPGPVAWASKQRVQLNSGYETIDWLCTDPSRITSDNRRVLEAHTRRHMALMLSGGEKREATYGDGAYRIRPGQYGTVTPGRIPRNVLVRGHRCADTLQYRRDAAALGLPIHGAMQPLSIADFLIRFLTAIGDVVVDPFGGTVTTGMAAEKLGRRWLVIEACLDYLRGGMERFRSCDGFIPNIGDLPRQ